MGMDGGAGPDQKRHRLITDETRHTFGDLPTALGDPEFIRSCSLGLIYLYDSVCIYSFY
jgi:hypothetical protein